MKRSKSSLWYELKLAFFYGGWLPLLILPLAVLWISLITTLFTDMPAAISRMLELLLPVVAALSAAPLMNMETQAGFAELRASYAEPWWRLPLSRSLMAALWTVIALGLGAFAFLASGGNLSLISVFPALSPTLFLMGLSLLVGNLTQNYWAAMGVSMGFWFINMAAHVPLTNNVVTSSLFLFAYNWPPDTVDFLVNRMLLAGTGILCFVLNSGWYWWTLRRGLRLHGSTA
ncbi:MAG TPA: hypothetical protein DCG78_05865 [Anaerolineaceae bacterium]|nr:hypothetical protein [Anaerolineaceae bacterium]